MDLLNDIETFISYWSLVDVIFYVAIIALLILLVTLAYFIKINREDEDIDDNSSNCNNFKDDNGNNVNGESNDIMDDIINNMDDIPHLEEENSEISDTPEDEQEGELLDLESLTKKLKESQNDDKKIEEYEKEQEEKAIISYNELLEKHNRYAINYEKEEVLDDLVVKKVDLNDLENKNVIDNSKPSVEVISYNKEEAFLKALKELNSLLN